MKRITIVVIFFSFIAVALYSVISFLPPKEDITKSISTKKSTKEEPSLLWIDSLPQHQTLFHVALGDSLANGYGSKQHGYVGMATTYLNENLHLQFQLENFAKNGITSEKLLTIVQKQAVKEKISTATLITISIGGNDILKLNKEMGIMEGAKLLGSIRKQYISNLTEILTIVRAENPDAVIVLSQLYNPLQLDGVIAKLADSFINDWNHDVSSLAKKFAPIVTIKTNKLLTYDTKDTWAYDEVHPNDVGYELLAEEMLKGLSALKVDESAHASK